MKYLRIIGLSYLLCSCHCGLAQSFDANSKKEGSIITHRELLVGKIDVNLELNQVLWTHDNSMRIVGASQIKQVVVDDTPRFAGKEWNEEFYLFEIIASGQVNILYREGIVKDELSNKTYSGYFTFVKDKLIPLEKKKDFFELMGGDDKWMSLHIKNNDLDFDTRNGIAAIFRYYNQTYEATHPSP